MHDKQGRESHRTQMRTMYHSDESYRDNSRARVRTAYHTNDKYREEQRAKMKKQYHTNDAYHDANKNRAKNRYLVQHKMGSARKQQEHREHICKYWARRSKLLARAKECSHILQLERNMQANSSIPQLDVKLEMKKAQQRLRRGQHMLSVLHTNLSLRAVDCLQQLPSDRSPTEGELSSAFNGQRLHTSHSEPYFWEQCYSVYADTTNCYRHRRKGTYL